jgi:alpha-amylase
LFWLGEFDELENPEHGKVFDASYSWNWMHKTREFCEKNLPIETLDTLLNRYSSIGDSSMRAWFTTNHDENSWNGTEYDKYGVAALPLAVFSATWNGVPLLYSGQELPNKKKLEFFEKDVIAWNGKFELAPFYKTLLTLHSNNPALRGGDKAVSTHRLKTSADDKVFAYVRKNGDRAVVVLLNLSKENADFQLTDDAGNGSYKDVFNGQDQLVSMGSKYQLAAGGYLVFEK